MTWEGAVSVVVDGGRRELEKMGGEVRGVTCLGAGNTLVGGWCGRLCGLGLVENRGSIVRWRGGVDAGQGGLCRRCRLLLCS